MYDQKQAILTQLQELLDPDLGESKITDVDGTHFLQLFPALFSDGSGRVYIEICLVDYSEDLTIAQVYSTIMPKAGPYTDKLNDHFAEWNMSSLAGSYGLYGEHKQLYHKQNVAIINTDSLLSQAKTLLAGLCLAMDEMARRLPEAIEIVFGDQIP